jgi:hypothetical protein
LVQQKSWEMQNAAQETIPPGDGIDVPYRQLNALLLSQAYAGWFAPVVNVSPGNAADHADYATGVYAMAIDGGCDPALTT